MSSQYESPISLINRDGLGLITSPISLIDRDGLGLTLPISLIDRDGVSLTPRTSHEEYSPIETSGRDERPSEARRSGGEGGRGG